jgi:hypothetical protein
VQANDPRSLCFAPVWPRLLAEFLPGDRVLRERLNIAKKLKIDFNFAV